MPRPGKLYEWNGRAQTIERWAAEVGLHRNTLRERLVAGWDIGRALTTPVAADDAERVRRGVASRGKTYRYKGKRRTLPEIARMAGVPTYLLRQRLRAGWPLREAAGRAPQVKKYYTHDGLTMGVKEWARRVGMKFQTLRRRLDVGWPFEKAIATPVRPVKHILTFGDRTMTVWKWAAERGLYYRTICDRVRHGWTPGQALGYDPPPTRTTAPAGSAAGR